MSFAFEYEVRKRSLWEIFIHVISLLIVLAYIAPLGRWMSLITGNLVWLFEENNSIVHRIGDFVDDVLRNRFELKLVHKVVGKSFDERQ